MAYHCLLWSYSHWIAEYIKRNKRKCIPHCERTLTSSYFVSNTCTVKWTRGSGWKLPLMVLQPIRHVQQLHKCNLVISCLVQSVIQSLIQNMLQKPILLIQLGQLDSFIGRSMSVCTFNPPQSTPYSSLFIFFPSQTIFHVIVTWPVKGIL